MLIILVILILISILIVIVVLGCLIRSHQIRYIDGFDKELENDYQAIVKQIRK